LLTTLVEALGRAHPPPFDPADVPVIPALIRALATHEKEPQAVVAPEASLLRDGFGERPLFQVTMAEWEGQPVGFAFWFLTYSTWRGQPTLFLEDLFVVPEARGKGVGKALMTFLARTALDHGCARFMWNVLDWNQPSIDFYESLGAKVLREWLTVRLDGEALVQLAGS
jgi:GNAT superfamily N-acetyltransferase